MIQLRSMKVTFDENGRPTLVTITELVGTVQQVPACIYTAIRDLRDKFNMIETIKLVRNMTGFGLREAKLLVENLDRYVALKGMQNECRPFVKSVEVKMDSFEQQPVQTLGEMLRDKIYNTDHS